MRRNDGACGGTAIQADAHAARRAVHLSKPRISTDARHRNPRNSDSMQSLGAHLDTAVIGPKVFARVLSRYAALDSKAAHLVRTGRQAARRLPEGLKTAHPELSERRAHVDCILRRDADFSQRCTASDPDLRLDEVDPSHFLRDCVLHLRRREVSSTPASGRGACYGRGRGLT